MKSPAPIDPMVITWLEALSLDRLGAHTLPGQIAAGLRHRLDYVRPPVAHRREVEATLRDPTAPSGDKSATATVHLGVYAGGQTAYAECNCGQLRGCPHATALLLDLAVSPELRQALCEGAPTEAFLRDLPARRAAALGVFAVDDLVKHWLPETSLAAPLDFTLLVAPAESEDYAPSASVLGRAQLELRVRASGTRSLLGAHDLGGLVLRGEDQRLLALFEPLSRSRKGFCARDVGASIALQLLRERGIRLERSEQPVGFSEVPLALRLARESVPAAWAPTPPPPGYYRGFLASGSRAFEALLDGAARLEASDPMAAVPGYEPGPSARRRRVVRGPRAARAPASSARVDALVGRWLSADGRVDVEAREAWFFPGPFPWVWVPSHVAFYPVDTATDQHLALRVDLRPALPLDGASPALVHRALRSRLRGRAVAAPAPETMDAPAGGPPEFTLRIEGAPLDVTLTLEARYPDGRVHALAGAPRPTALASDEDPIREPEAESAALARVLAVRGVETDEISGAIVARGASAVRFWTEGVVALRSHGDPALEVVIADALRGVRVRGPVRARVRVSLLGGGATAWLDTAVDFDADEVSAEIDALRAAVSAGQRWVALSDGSLAEIHQNVAELVRDVDAALPSKRARGKLAPHQLGRLERWIETADAAAIDPDVEALRTTLRALAVAPPRVPASLAATLRPYQLQGLAWLQFLDALGAGGILADDMGLGKTLMTLAQLLACRDQRGTMPSLVVCPTSVAGNWVREAARFAPDLTVLLWHGLGRDARRDQIPTVDLVVTTYGLLREDAELLAAQPFRYVVLDEAQNIKNADAATTHAARALRAERRLALTGTPIENRLAELWSLMDFCNPGMLGTSRDFETRFERPIVSDPHDASGAARTLAALVRPFVLRRTKREVLDDLPPKEEIEIACVFAPRQRRLYDALATALRREVEAKIAVEGVAKSGLSILTALLRLRQMACDPRLIDASVPASASAKRESFLARVRELVAEGRRALVFSQFVELLTLWRADLDREGIAYEYLDGATRDRDARVARFQHGSAPLFLISLRAGGTGLNLTAADTVIHCDPWWNPAVEDQATDRAHRIGQARAVSVYRLVARGTVEDRIMALKLRKRALADAVVRADAGALRGLSATDVSALLGDVDTEFDEPDARGIEREPASLAPPAPPHPPQPQAGPASAPPPPMARVSGEALAQLAHDARVWLRAPGRRQRDLAERAGLATSDISLLLNERIRSMPGDRAARIRQVITET